MTLTLILVTAVEATPTAVDAERKFSRDAKTRGQWTATRAYADADAVMFTPQAIWARDFLKGRKDPRAAIRWSPNASYVSCDGRTAVNTGPWQTADGRQHGFFTTVWQQDKGQWHWTSDGRHTLKKPLAVLKVPLVRTASCKSRAPGPPLMARPTTKRGPGGVAADDFGREHSADRTSAGTGGLDSLASGASARSCGMVEATPLPSSKLSAASDWAGVAVW